MASEPGSGLASAPAALESRRGPAAHDPPRARAARAEARAAARLESQRATRGHSRRGRHAEPRGGAGRHGRASSASPAPHRARIDDIDEEVRAARVPIGFAKQHRLLPIGARPRTDEAPRRGRKPLDMAPLDDLRLLFDGAEIELELASRARSWSAPSTPSTTAARPRPISSPRRPATISTPSRRSIGNGAAGPARGHRRRADHPAS